jgi:hypothetical protein
MLRSQKQCLPDGIKFEMAGHSKGGQGLKRAMVTQKKKKNKKRRRKKKAQM